jgi:hypothetical protein
MMARFRRAVLVTVTAALAAYPLAASPAPASASQRAPAAAQAAGRAAPLHMSTSRSDRRRAVMGSPTSGPQGAAAGRAAAAQARRTGRPVAVPALTTSTVAVTAEPGGQLKLVENSVPVRVRRPGGWAPVSTTLRRTGDGRWAAAAVPADTISFSGGGTGPAAVIGAGRTSLALSWPGRLPAPVISGPAAIYRDVLPGIDLTLTATSADAGGFTTMLTVRTRTAARDRGLAHLNLTLSGHGATVTRGPGGSLVAPAAGGAGEYTGTAAQQQDSARDPVGPSGTARLAPVAATLTRTGGPARLSLAPGYALLAVPATRFPVYITPSDFQWSPATGNAQDRDEAQSACPDASHYDLPTTYPDTYWSLGVGNDGWTNPPDCDGKTGWARTYYQMGVPSDIWGAHLHTATLSAQEAWAASCGTDADVTLFHSDTINRGTDWANMPGSLGSLNPVKIVPIQPGKGKTPSCGTLIDTDSKQWEAVPFNVLSFLTPEAAAHAATFTFGLEQPGTATKYSWIRFGPHPTLSVEYGYTPNVPSDEMITADTDGAGSVGCDTSPDNPPLLGEVASQVGPALWAMLTSQGPNQLEGSFQYWDQSTGGSHSTTSGQGRVASGAYVKGFIPPSWLATVHNRDVVGWQAQASNGMFASSWSAPCYFAVDPDAPAAPAITDNLGGHNAQMGQSVTFTITAAPGDPATSFAWGLDVPPPVADVPASQIVKLKSGATKATVKVTVPSPGPHGLWAYAIDAAGNESGAAEDSFAANGDQSVSYISFAAALGAGRPFDNTMIAPGSGQVNGDGAGHSFAATDLENAGWQPGGPESVDGASFTLPGFGRGGPDNLLAANQTIGLGGAQGSALVMLATSTDATTQVPGTTTGMPSASLLSEDLDAPLVTGGVPVTGTGCTAATAFDTNEIGCLPASGLITYTGGVTSHFIVTVPDWSAGPADIAAGSFPHQVCTASGCSEQQAQLYAFAIPLAAGLKVKSITLPDVGDTVSATVSASGTSYQQPGLHIFGLALRDTTTATPGAAAAANQASTAGQDWTPAFTSPIEDGYAPAAPAQDWANQTIRMAVSPAVSAAKGSSYVRIRLSDPAFQAGQAGAPLEIGAATIAPQQAAGSPAAAGTPQPLTFDTSTSVTIPEGGASTATRARCRSPSRPASRCWSACTWRTGPGWPASPPRPPPCPTWPGTAGPAAPPSGSAPLPPAPPPRGTRPRRPARGLSPGPAPPTRWPPACWPASTSPSR